MAGHVATLGVGDRDAVRRFDDVVKMLLRFFQIGTHELKYNATSGVHWVRPARTLNTHAEK